MFLDQDEAVRQILATRGAFESNRLANISACPKELASWYCLNGSICFEVRVEESVLHNCWCSNGYQGLRCDYKYSTPSAGSIEITPDSRFISVTENQTFVTVHDMISLEKLPSGLHSSAAGPISSVNYNSRICSLVYEHPKTILLLTLLFIVLITIVILSKIFLGNRRSPGVLRQASINNPQSNISARCMMRNHRELNRISDDCDIFHSCQSKGQASSQYNYQLRKIETRTPGRTPTHFTSISQKILSRNLRSDSNDGTMARPNVSS